MSSCGIPQVLLGFFPEETVAMSSEKSELLGHDTTGVEPVNLGVRILLTE